MRLFRYQGNNGIDALLPPHPIDRIPESRLDHETFSEQYVRQGKPLIIVRDVTGPWKNVSSALIDNCGHLELSAVPIAAQNVHASFGPRGRRLYHWMLKLTVGINLAEWCAKRERVSFEEVRREAIRNGDDTNVTEKIPRWFRYIAPAFLPRMLELYIRPFYLADLVWDEDHALFCGVPTQRSLAEQRVVAELTARTREKIFKKDENQRYFWMFWGGKDSSLYPLHRDNSNHDVMIDVYEGCKDFVIVHPNERQWLSAIPLEGAQIWSDDFFSSGRPVSMERVWRGMVLPGETLYLPGDSLHEARNRCPNTLSSSTRPWHGADVRADIFPAKFGL
eukprot:CAMPEP_0172529352 /NCGR_PEP_ID=MMETSP1067-20121228/3456_1 /TAXON_ID=265564 ORGANISM="Thalassiosira punctigera, Strain Tpunct2005C2" /NCGR_SAMPLE_ID=MMETSP1067 /ASSEMBLY_ACC=CAM_ASM_000444 /LENGTH=334 /DNA_ID=CAMNT_0013313385 /DNA_START=45 /DNA_END=1049 /DNA_ORIENTATION=-